MSSVIRFHYDPILAFESLFDDAPNARVWACPALPQAARAPRTNRSQHPVDSFRPRMDLTESKDSNTVTATFELPGLKPEDVTIDLGENRLTISGESVSSSSRSDEQDGYVFRERRSGKFSRTLQLPFGTKPEDVKAKLENGLLTVTFPKTTPEQEPQRIAIQSQ